MEISINCISFAAADRLIAVLKKREESPGTIEQHSG
jgi:hypothetical protein